MNHMQGLTSVDRGNEQEYVDLFCSEYKDPINTPDGFTVICRCPIATAKHICGGKQRKFQKTRARCILWPKYILLHTDERKLLIDNKSKNLIFFFEKRKTAYVVVCDKLKDGRLDLISGFVAGGKRANNYRKGISPYSFYEK